MRAARPSSLKRILPIALALSQAGPAGAQRYLVHDYTEQDGLPVSEVGDVEQDPSGRLWCATRAGIVLYDGSTWQSVEAPDGLALRDVQSLRIDSCGRTWALQRNGSLYLGTSAGLERWPSNPALRGRTVFMLDWDLLEHASGDQLVVATYEGDLYLCAEGGWRTLDGSAGGIGSARAVEAAHGRFYVGGDAGLAALEADGATFSRVELPAGVDPAIHGLYCDRTFVPERLWVQGPDWIGLCNGDQVEICALGVPEPKEFSILPLVHAPDGRGGLYYGNSVGLYHFDRELGRVQRLGSVNGFVAEGARGLLHDREGLLWAATGLGISKLVSTSWATYGADSGLSRGETSALTQLADGSIALGHNGGLTLYRDGRFEPIDLERELPSDPGRSRVLDLDSDAQGNLWLAASALGLGRRTPDGTWSWYLVPQQLSEWAAAVLCGRDGTVWVGTPRGLMHLDGEELRPVSERALPVQYVRCLAETPAGRLLVGGELGLWVETERAWAQIPAPTAEQANGVFALLQDRSGHLWAGARDGLWRVQEGKLAPPPFELPRERQVYTLVEDAQGRLWIGTDFGVYRWNGSQLDHFTVRDGLSGNETNRAAGLVDRQGDLWLGTEKGLSVFRPAGERRDQPPQVELLATELDGARRPPEIALELQGRRHELVFRARALSLVDEGALQWRTRFAGDSAEWTEREGNCVLEVRHAVLPAGRYQFQVQARRGEGEWGPVASSAYLTVVGPFWTRPWFYLLAALATAALGSAWQRFASQRRYARRLESEVRRRSAELAAYQGELARTERLRSLGLLAGGIAHDFNNVLAALMGSLSLLRLRSAGRRDSEPLLDRADEALERGKQLSTQLLTFAKGGEPVKRVVSLAQLVDDSTRLALSGSAVRADRDLPADLWPVRVDPAQICQTLENLLVNACQSMPTGGAVRLRARNVDGGAGHATPRPGRFVSLEVSDDGPGIPAEVLPRVFEPFFTTKRSGSGLGLATALSVIERHGGKLTVQSPPGAGATFTLVLPAAASEPAAVDHAPRAQRAAPKPGRALVMDDDPDVRGLLEEILGALGWETISAASGEEALAALRAASGARFRCAILDLTVQGGLGGVAALRRLREIDPDLPALATSGYTDDAVMSRPLDFGFQGALPKPFRVGDVAAALEQLELDTVS
jgi:signal transduction histidine kinase/CheY-like chemotaxis protein